MVNFFYIFIEKTYKISYIINYFIIIIINLNNKNLKKINFKFFSLNIENINYITLFN